MRVLITGGTGFVGSHVCRQLIAAGQEVRLLVRSLEKAERIYASLSSPLLNFIEGDITDAAAVKRAVEGCHALVHAAAATPIKTDSSNTLFKTNVDGLKNVVDAALAAGVQQVVCLSSITAIFNADASKVTADAEPVASTMPYGQSKVEGEQYLRALQSQGAPVAILYPGAIIGPDDPGFSDSFMALKHRVENGFRIFDDGGMQYIDVRDLAALAVALLNDGSAGRYLTPGVYYKWATLADIWERVSGCTLERIPAKGWKLRMVGRVLDFVRLFKTVDTPISAETMRYATLWPNIPNTEQFAARGINLRSGDETFGDAMAWMVAAGHVDPGLCPAFKRSEGE